MLLLLLVKKKKKFFVFYKDTYCLPVSIKLWQVRFNLQID